MKENKDNKGIKENTKVSTSKENIRTTNYRRYVNGIIFRGMRNLPGNDR